MKRNPDTQGPDYTERLIRKQERWWKRALHVQAPYRWNLRRLKPGYTLEIGCGIGRNLAHLDGHAVGIDHNRQSVTVARNRGFTAMPPEEFLHSSYDESSRYDSLLAAHVAEHMTLSDAIELISLYLHNLRPGGTLILIAPQEAGFRSDATHVEFMDFEKLRRIHSALDLTLEKEYSFPFPRFIGHGFVYNEFISVGRKTS